MSRTVSYVCPGCARRTVGDTVVARRTRCWHCGEVLHFDADWNPTFSPADDPRAAPALAETVLLGLTIFGLLTVLIFTLVRSILRSLIL